MKELQVLSSSDNISEIINTLKDGDLRLIYFKNEDTILPVVICMKFYRFRFVGMPELRELQEFLVFRDGLYKMGYIIADFCIKLQSKLDITTGGDIRYVADPRFSCLTDYNNKYIEIKNKKAYLFSDDKLIAIDVSDVDAVVQEDIRKSFYKDTFGFESLSYFSEYLIRGDEVYLSDMYDDLRCLVQVLKINKKYAYRQYDNIARGNALKTYYNIENQLLNKGDKNLYSVDKADKVDKNWYSIGRSDKGIILQVPASVNINISLKDAKYAITIDR